MTEDEKKAIEEVYRHRSADVSRCWAKYGLNLLSDSKDRLMMEDSEIQSRSILFIDIHISVYFDHNNNIYMCSRSRILEYR